MSKVADFVKRMGKQGRKFEVNGNFVVISPTNGLAMSDLNVAPKHKSPQDKVDGQCNSNPECNAGYGNQSADDVWFHGLSSCGEAANVELMICWRIQLAPRANTSTGSP